MFFLSYVNNWVFHPIIVLQNIFSLQQQSQYISTTRKKNWKRLCICIYWVYWLASDKIYISILFYYKSVTYFLMKLHMLFSSSSNYKYFTRSAHWLINELTDFSRIPKSWQHGCWGTWLTAQCRKFVAIAEALMTWPVKFQWICELY